MKNRWNYIFRILSEVYLYIADLKIDACRLLLALNNNQTLNNNLFSWSTSVQCTDVAQQLTEGITLFLRAYWSYCMEDSVKTQVGELWHSWKEVVHGVVFSLTQLDSVELVVSSLTEWYTSESGVN